MKHIVISLIFVFAAFAAGAVTPAAADSAYSKENYDEAIALYNSLLGERGRSAEIYYNLGNAYYRKGEIGNSVLSYERALRVNPSHADARANLAFVNSRLEDRPEDNNSFLTRLHRSVVLSMSADAWAWIALTSFVLFCAAVALYIFSANVTLRKLGFFGAFVLLVLTVYFVVVAVNAASHFNDHSEAVVTAPSTLLNSAPRQPGNTEKVVPLHEGTKVEIIDSIATPDDPVSPMWYNVRINGSASAWLRATDVERI